MRRSRALEVFVPAQAELTSLVRDFLLATLPDDRALTSYVALPRAERIVEAAAAVGHIRDVGLSVQTLADASLSDLKDMRRRRKAELTVWKVETEIARTLTQSLNELARQVPPEGFVLATANGLPPRMAQFFLPRLHLPLSRQDTASPLLAAELHRLAALPDLPLLVGQLTLSGQSEVRLIPEKHSIPLRGAMSADAVKQAKSVR